MSRATAGWFRWEDFRSQLSRIFEKMDELALLLTLRKYKDIYLACRLMLPTASRGSPSLSPIWSVLQVELSLDGPQIDSLETGTKGKEKTLHFKIITGEKCPSIRMSFGLKVVYRETETTFCTPEVLLGPPTKSFTTVTAFLGDSNHLACLLTLDNLTNTKKGEQTSQD